MAASMARESSYMPTVKCSSCGRDVEISMMGEHTCAGEASEPVPAMPSMFTKFLGLGGSSASSSSARPEQEKSARAAPPNVDTVAANRSFLTQGVVTPASLSSGSRSVSPKTPNGPRPGFDRPDDYFAPRVVHDSPPSQQSRRQGGYGGGFGDQGDVVDPVFPNGNSPKNVPSVLDRMNGIAPGPFNMGRRGSDKSSKFLPRRLGSTNGPMSNDGLGAENRPSTSASNMSSGGSGCLRMPRVPQDGGYAGFGPPGAAQEDFEPNSFGGSNRSGTFPRQSPPSEGPARTPPEPGAWPSRTRQHSVASQMSDTSGSTTPPNGSMRRPSKDTSRAPPPRTGPILKSPGILSINLAAEFGIDNPYHHASYSELSGGSRSGYSAQSSQSRRPSQLSSRSSSSRSIASRSDRNPSDASNPDENNNLGGLAPSRQPPMDKFRPKPAPLTPSAQLYGAYSVAGSITDGFGDAREKRPPPPKDNRAPCRPHSPETPDTPDQAAPPQRQSRVRPPLTAGPFNPYSQPPAQHDSGIPPTPSTSSGGSGGGSRGFCRACGETITGKSISSRDGRLTGKYHKACFVCTTCREPFPSSTFYVLDDKPYCELDYHRLNGSLCEECGIGIEGPYLAKDESPADEAVEYRGRGHRSGKYHVGCFRCPDCRVVLQDGYCEVDGQAYCERDAWRRMQQPWQAQLQNQPPPPNGFRRPSPGPSNLGASSYGPRMMDGPRASGMGPPPAGMDMGMGMRSGGGGMARMEKRRTRMGMVPAVN